MTSDQAQETGLALVLASEQAVCGASSALGACLYTPRILHSGADGDVVRFRLLFMDREDFDFGSG